MGGVLRQTFEASGVEVTTTSRAPGGASLPLRAGSELDSLLAERDFDQIVHLPQLTSPDGDQFLDRVDGSRWLVFSSAQLASSIPRPGEDLARAREATALARGATVLRPTMIFGRGGDVNISRVIRHLRRYRLPLVIGDGRQRLQPVHVDDIAALVIAHGRRPRAGLFEVGGDAQLTAMELMEALRREVGLRVRPVRLPSAWCRRLSVLPLPGLRRDQVLRLEEDKVVDVTRTSVEFSWRPVQLRDRLSQAVQEVLRGSRAGDGVDVLSHGGV